MTHKGTQALANGGILLRPYTMDDAQAMYENWAGDPEVTRHLTWDAHPSAEASRLVLLSWTSQYERPGYYNWGIVHEGTLVGNIAVVRADDANECAEIGYCLGRAWWGRGLMTEALRLVADFLLGEVGVHRLTLRHDVENVASGRVMAKNGFVREGTLRKANKRRDGRYADLAVYGLLREEWAEARLRTGPAQ